MQIVETVFGDVTVVTCQGSMVLFSGPDLLRDKMNSLQLRDQTKVILDVAGVPYIDSAGLQATVQAYTMVRRRNGRLVLCGLSKRIQDLLAITKLLTVFDVYDSIDEALASFHAARFEVSCPVCRPQMWTNYLGARFLLSCPDCDARFTPRVADGALASLGSDEAASSRVVATVTDLWWFTYYENGYGQEGVHLTLGRPTIVAISGRLDLFALDTVLLAWEAVPSPRRVLFDTTHVRISTPAGSARLGELCTTSADGSRASVLANAGDRDRATAALGSVESAAQSLDVAIRRKS